MNHLAAVKEQYAHCTVQMIRLLSALTTKVAVDGTEQVLSYDDTSRLDNSEDTFHNNTILR